LVLVAQPAHLARRRLDCGAIGLMAAVDALRAAVRGEVLVPADDGYDSARAVWNAMVDRRPRLIVRCAYTSDVVTAVRTARDLQLEIGVRCGGHSVVGLAVPEGGLMIDLTPMASATVDAAHRTATVQGGALLGILDAAAQEHGLATTAGNVSHTGVGGLTLGGGMGWLARQHGLTCDSVRSFELVTAGGDVLRVSAEENPDLFWGLRGGGGNFGVVTEFEFDLYPLRGPMLTAEVDAPLDNAVDVLRAWRDFCLAAPRSLTGLAVVDGGVATIGFVWVGDHARGLGYVDDLRGLVAQPLSERVTTPSYVELQRREDTIKEHEIRRYWKGHYFRTLDDEAIATLVDGANAPDAPAASLQAYGGAIADVGDDASAFSQRETAFELVAAARWTDPNEDNLRVEGARRFAARLEPFASGAYVNVLGDEGQRGVRRAYGSRKLQQLTALKDRYDPDNVFHLNQNIRPSVEP
jgi:FAD/FMN-containing dehydrogenase